jgi:hypothetical protein
VGVEARRVRTDKRWDADVGAGGGKPGSVARVWRSLDVDNIVTSSQPKGCNTTTASRRTVATGGAARSGGGGLHD